MPVPLAKFFLLYEHQRGATYLKKTPSATPSHSIVSASVRDSAKRWGWGKFSQDTGIKNTLKSAKFGLVKSRGNCWFITGQVTVSACQFYGFMNALG